jgi:hypothetical protein
LRAGAIGTFARHAGLALGLLLIAPVLAGALDVATERAALAGTATVLDARIPLPDKMAVAGSLRDGLAVADRGHVPDVQGLVVRTGGGTPASRDLGERLAQRLREVLTRAFRSSFGVAAALAGAVVLPGALILLRRSGSAGPRRLPGPAQALVVITTAALIAGLLAAQVSAGAPRFGAVSLSDPCQASPDPYPGSGLDAWEQKVILSTLNGAACSLHVSRESLVLSLDGSSGVGAAGLTADRVQPALRAGLTRAVDDAERRGDLPGLVALALRGLVARAPLQWLSDRLGLPAS